MTTDGGVTITRSAEAFDPAELTRIAELVDRRRGGVLSSGMEYPGRYSRWHLAYADPPLEIACRGRLVTARALNARGLVLMPAIRDAMLRVGVGQSTAPGTVTVHVPEGEGTFTEEERSRRPTVFSVLREITAAFACPDAHLGLYGAFGYDLAFQFEPVRLAIDRSDDQRDMVLHLPDQIWAVDLRREEARRYSYEFDVAGNSTAGLPRDTEPTPVPAPGAGTLPPQPAPGRYAAVVEQAKERFKCGDLFEVVPGHMFHERCASPSLFYERLRERNPAPFEFLFNLGDGEYLVGASPEMYVRVNGDRVETCPISGTIARGADPLEDAANIARLLGSAKEESELTMCTDVDRNDKSRVCVPGSVRVIGRRQIEMYSRLIHTVDHIEGRLRPGFDALDAFLTHMWAVTVTGAPKTWAMQFIEDNEDTRRRWYGGAVGAIGFDGSMNTGLTLRTASIRDGIAAIRVGATLLYDSDPESEERETHIKARALLETLREVEEARLAAERASTGQAPAVIAAPGPAGSWRHARHRLLRHWAGAAQAARAARRPPGLIRAHPGGLLPPARRRGDHAAVRLRRGAARRDGTRPGRLVAGAWPARRLRLRRPAVRARQQAAARFRCLPRPAGDGRARRRRAVAAARAAARQARPDPGARRLRERPVRRAARRVHRRALPLPVRAGGGRQGRLHGHRRTPLDGGRDGVVMAIEDEAAGRWAVQFHPESILTAAGRSGHRIIANVLGHVRARAASSA